MTQDALATAVGISRKSILRYEGDDGMPHPETLKRLCEVLGVSAEWLTAGVTPYAVIDQTLDAGAVRQNAAVYEASPSRPHVSEEQRRLEHNQPVPSDPAPEPLAPPGVVLFVVVSDPMGRPVYGLTPGGREVQLGPAIRATAAVG